MATTPRKGAGVPAKKASPKSPAKTAKPVAKTAAARKTAVKKAAAPAFNEPLFVKMLTGQNKQAQAKASEVSTAKYPNDNADIVLNAERMHVVSEKKTGKNADTIYQTMKYPSDADELAVTLKYPSDSDEDLSHFRQAASATTSLIADQLEMVTKKYPSDTDELAADFAEANKANGAETAQRSTLKYPSDADDIDLAAASAVPAPARPDVTKKYPSDSDELYVTQKYPSDRDEISQ